MIEDRRAGTAVLPPRNGLEREATITRRRYFEYTVKLPEAPPPGWKSGGNLAPRSGRW